jgi:hypothetical protein
MREASKVDSVWDPLSTPDIVLPSQYFALTGARYSLSSEQRLMLAVLVDAINIINGGRGNGSARKRGLYGEAHDWVFTSGNGRPFSFENVCDGLGLEPEMLRRRLSDMNNRGTPFRLRLKESGRAHNVTVNRVRHRPRKARRRAQDR